MKKLLFAIFITFAFLFGGCFTMVGTTIESIPQEESCEDDSSNCDVGVKVEDSDVDLKWFTSSHLALGFSFGYIHGPWYYSWEYPYYWDDGSYWYYWYKPYYGWYRYPRHYTPRWYRNYERHGRAYGSDYRIHGRTRWHEHPRARINEQHPRSGNIGRPHGTIRQPKNFNTPRNNMRHDTPTMRQEHRNVQRQWNSSPRGQSSPSYSVPHSGRDVSPGNSYSPGRAGNSAGNRNTGSGNNNRGERRR